MTKLQIFESIKRFGHYNCSTNYVSKLSVHIPIHSPRCQIQNDDVAAAYHEYNVFNCFDAATCVVADPDCL